MDSKSISIIGPGGVGGYFGFKINESSSKHSVTFVARGETYEILQQKGLTLLSPEHDEPLTRPDHVVERITELPKSDLILLCIKAYDLENVCKQLKEVVNKDTVIMPLMNGADIYEQMRAWLPEPVILPTSVYVASHIKEKGIIEHKGKGGKLVYGKDPQRPQTELSWIAELFTESKINYSFHEDVYPAIWKKYILIASFGLVTARYNSSFGVVCQDEFQRKRCRLIMEEIQAIASEKGVDLPSDIISRTFGKAETFLFQTPTSLQLDIHSGKGKSELEIFAGAILKMGETYGVDTPETEKIYREILELAAV